MHLTFVLGELVTNVQNPIERFFNIDKVNSVGRHGIWFNLVNLTLERVSCLGYPFTDRREKKINRKLVIPRIHGHLLS